MCTTTLVYSQERRLMSAGATYKLTWAFPCSDSVIVEVPLCSKGLLTIFIVTVADEVVWSVEMRHFCLPGPIRFLQSIKSFHFTGTSEFPTWHVEDNDWVDFKSILKQLSVYFHKDRKQKRPKHPDQDTPPSHLLLPLGNTIMF